MATKRFILTVAFITTAMAGCQRDAPTPVVDDGGNPLLAMNETVKLTIEGEKFEVALANDQTTRVKGLGDVPEIPEGHGMLFVFSQSQYLSFVMRDCLVDIDIAYLLEDGMIGKIYTMAVEPREEGESDTAYESRLKTYPSGFSARMALELRAGTLERLGVSVGDRVEIKDLEGLKERAN